MYLRTYAPSKDSEASISVQSDQSFMSVWRKRWFSNVQRTPNKDSDKPAVRAGPSVSSLDAYVQRYIFSHSGSYYLTISSSFQKPYLVQGQCPAASIHSPCFLLRNHLVKWKQQISLCLLQINPNRKKTKKSINIQNQKLANQTKVLKVLMSKPAYRTRKGLRLQVVVKGHGE